MTEITCAARATENIRPATREELSWISGEPNPRVMAEIAKAEIEEALTATSRPRQWTPIDVDAALLR